MATKKRNTRSASKTDAVKLLTADHAKVKKLFRQFEKLKEDGDAREKSALVEEIIFYPAVREAIDDEGLVDEADVEHESAKTLIAQLSRMRPGEDHYDAR